MLQVMMSMSLHETYYTVWFWLTVSSQAVTICVVSYLVATHAISSEHV